MRKRSDSDQEFEQDEDLIMDQNPAAGLLDGFESAQNITVVKLDILESGLLLVSSIGSDEFSKYVVGSKLKEDLEDLMKKLSEDLSQA